VSIAPRRRDGPIPPSIVLRTIAAAAVSLLLACVAAGSVLAHAELVGSDPADKATLEAPPTQVALTFSEDLDPAKSSFKLLGPDGSTIGTGAATATRLMTLDGLSLAPGAYLVEWTSASAADGDIDRGKITFTVATAPASASPTRNDVISPEPSTTPAPASSSSGGDVLLPIVVALLVVAGIGAFVLRRSRGA
jgi:hypothetical protein